jgi:hypothetical protein
MITVFLSGSRRISRINGPIRNHLDNMIRQGYRVVISDANGADKAFQIYIARSGYPNVTVFCSGEACRNNIGKWEVRKIQVDKQFKGLEFYA